MSSLRIVEPTEAIVVEHSIFLIYGQPGIGKTSLGFSAENTLLLNYDTESAIARAVNRGRSINVLTVEQQEELQTDGAELFKPFQSITIDPIGACVNLMAEVVIARNPKYGKGGSLTLQGFGQLKADFRKWFTHLRTLQKNLLFVAHNKEEGDSGGKFNRPDITGASLSEVLRLSDFVGFLYMNGKERVLDFSPTESWFGKNPAQWPALKVPAPEHARTFMAQLFAKGREALSKESESSAVAANQVLDWTAAIGTKTSLEEFNKIVPEIRELKPPVQPQVIKILMKQAETHGFKYDYDRKVFFVPAKQQQEQATLNI